MCLFNIEIGELLSIYSVLFKVFKHYVCKLFSKELRSCMNYVSCQEFGKMLLRWFFMIFNHINCIERNLEYKLKFVILNFPLMIVELWSNLQNLLEMRKIELSEHKFFNSILNSCECGNLLSAYENIDTLIDVSLKLIKKFELFF